MKSYPDHTSWRKFVNAVQRAGKRNLVREVVDPLILANYLQILPEDMAAAAKSFQFRPIYTAEELANLWPLICIGLLKMKKIRHAKGAVLEKQLSKRGLPFLKNVDGTDLFFWNGKRQKYFIVENIEVRNLFRYTQESFEEIMNNSINKKDYLH